MPDTLNFLLCLVNLRLGSTLTLVDWLSVVLNFNRQLVQAIEARLITFYVVCLNFIDTTHICLVNLPAYRKAYLACRFLVRKSAILNVFTALGPSLIPPLFVSASWRDHGRLQNFPCLLNTALVLQPRLLNLSPLLFKDSSLVISKAFLGLSILLLALLPVFVDCGVTLLLL